MPDGYESDVTNAIQDAIDYSNSDVEIETADPKYDLVVTINGVAYGVYFRIEPVQRG
jgi:hypothetical protein